jgi:hypothetical protein
MKYVIIALLTCMNAFGVAQNGIGLQIGSMTGVSYNHHFEQDATYHFTLSSKTDLADITVNRTIRKDSELYFDRVPFGYAYGGGLSMQTVSGNEKVDNNDDSLKLGASGYLSTYHHFSNAPVEIGIVFNPVVFLISEVEVDTRVNLYAHYFF